VIPNNPMHLYSERIEVEHKGETEDEPSRPVSFVWRDEEFLVESILEVRQDWGFPAGAPPRKTWRLRRHRTYFTVRTACGRTFEIYMDRKTPAATWVLYREIEN
jgi:hypothetical protein